MIAIVGTEAEARTLVSHALALYIGETKAEGVLTVIGTQWPEGWLPAIAGVQFTRLASNNVDQCNRVFWVYSLKREPDQTVAVGMVDGTWCRNGGTLYRFSHAFDGWHLRQDTDGGLENGTVGCPCR